MLDNRYKKIFASTVIAILMLITIALYLFEAPLLTSEPQYIQMLQSVPDEIFFYLIKILNIVLLSRQIKIYSGFSYD
jgi:hypothetical protein